MWYGFACGAQCEIQCCGYMRGCQGFAKILQLLNILWRVQNELKPPAYVIWLQ